VSIIEYKWKAFSVTAIGALMAAVDSSVVLLALFPMAAVLNSTAATSVIPHGLVYQLFIGNLSGKLPTSLKNSYLQGGASPSRSPRSWSSSH